MAILHHDEQKFFTGPSSAIAVLEEEFIAQTQAQITNKYNIRGNIIIGASSGRFGTIQLESIGSAIGDSLQLDTDLRFHTRSNDNAYVFETTFKINSKNSGNAFVFCGFSGPIPNGISTTAGLEASNADMAGFVFDGAVGGTGSSWGKLARKAGVGVTTFSGRAVSTGFFLLRMVFTKATALLPDRLDFFEGDEEPRLMTSISGLSTNVPLANQGFVIYSGNVNAIQQSIDIDFLKVATQRDFG